MPPQTIYLIRHGEKPGGDADGLSAQGIKRSQYLAHFFGTSSYYNIGYILAEHPKKNGKRVRPYETVAPLAKNLSIKIDDSVDRDDAQGAAAAAMAFSGANVLICWEHGQLADIAAAIGVQGEVKYPGDRFDLVWEITEPYTKIGVSHQHCPGLDDKGPKDGDEAETTNT